MPVPPDFETYDSVRCEVGQAVPPVFSTEFYSTTGSHTALAWLVERNTVCVAFT
jgi:hypothetical protein